MVSVVDMLDVRCPHCSEELEVPSTLAGCKVRCHRCDGVVHVPGLADEDENETGKPKFDVLTGVHHPQRSQEVQHYVDALMERAKKESERKPYNRKRFPVDLIVGVVGSIGGLPLLCSGAGVLIQLLGGFLLLLGAASLMSWFLYRQWR